MKFTLSWLKEHLDTNLSLEEIAAKLTALGLEVESVQDRAKIYEPFHVAYVVSAEKHPDADRLKVCIVDTGKEKLQVVCGAPNARTGMKGIFAPEGSIIPGNGMTLKKGKIRGQESCGMLVSEEEMALPETIDGIIEVPDSAAVGTPLAQLYGLDDPVIEINLTPNRADCAGVRGIARDLAAAGAGKLKPLDEKPVDGSFKSPIGIKIDNEEACPYFIGRYIKGVKNGSSPDWLQRRLKAIGLRPISALVDITNYISYDLCRPLHVFDADKLKGDISVRPTKKGEDFDALDGHGYKVIDGTEGAIGIYDDSGLIGFGGIVGGISTSCDQATTDVFLEVAYFNPQRTARTGRDYRILSDARYRFERGVDPAFLDIATEIATRFIIDLCGGMASEIVKAGKPPVWQRSIPYDPACLRQLAGFDIAEKQQQKILEDLGFAVKTGTSWTVMPPSWRADIEGRADIVEEIVRINGYDEIPPVSMAKPDALTQNAETPLTGLARKARGALAARGLNQSVTWSFMPHELAEKFGGNDNQAAASLRLVNPIGADMDQMRPSLLPNLIAATRRNADRGFADAALFEVGPAFSTAKTTGQSLVAGGVRQSAIGPRHWSGAQASRNVDLFDAKADALAALEACGAPITSLQISRDAPRWYHPKRSGALRLGANVVACFGEIHPGLLEDMKVDAPMAAFEVFLDRIPQGKRKGTAKPLLALSPFQPLTRDFAFIVDRAVAAEDIVRAARGVDKSLIESADIFDVYEGKGMEDGKKSVAVTITIQPRTQTLTDAEIEALSKKIVDAIAAKTGGVLRS